MSTRLPKQQRSRQTVEAVLDAVTRVVARHGVAGVTTNRIADAAGVSIGSVYQYFPDKQAIYKALHDRHVEAIARVVESTVVAHAASSLDVLVRALVDALVDAHAEDPGLHEILAQVPEDRAHGLESRLRNALALALSARARIAHDKLARMLFVLPPMIEALAHAVHRRPSRLSMGAAKEEARRAVLAYLTKKT